MRRIKPPVVFEMQPLVACSRAPMDEDLQPMVASDRDEFHLGERLGELIERSGKPQTALASHMGVSTQAVQKWINTGGFAREHVRRICKFLGCTPDQLFGYAPIDAQEMAPESQSQSMEVDLEMLKSAIAATKEAFAAFGRVMDAYDSAPLIAFAYRERTLLPKLMSKAEYKAFDAMVTAKLRGDLGDVQEGRQIVGSGQGGTSQSEAHKKLPRSG
jgi:DNA-binding Xre family transcriptional regulator